MFDNTPDDNVGVDATSMDDIALILANTRHDIRETIEDVLGWDFTAEILREVLKRVNQCESCGRWLPVRLDRVLCQGCAGTLAGQSKSRLSTVTDADVKWLRSIRVRFNSKQSRCQSPNGRLTR
jgi:hypothetical protein